MRTITVVLADGPSRSVVIENGATYGTLLRQVDMKGYKFSTRDGDITNDMLNSEVPSGVTRIVAARDSKAA